METETRKYNYIINPADSYPITLEQILAMITHAKSKCFASYLNRVLRIAEKKIAPLNKTLQDVEFTLSKEGITIHFEETKERHQSQSFINN